MKKVFSLLLALGMVLGLAACGTTPSLSSSAADASGAVSSGAAVSTGDNEAITLSVFAAASMTETLDEIIGMYEAENPNVSVVPTYDSSGTLLRQIKEGAECDLFISAAQTQMNALDGSLVGDTDKNPDGLDMLVPGSRVDLLENQVVLVVPDGNPAGITGFSDIATKVKLIALGNSDVPVGSYSLEILDYLGLDVTALEQAGKITYGSNVKEVTTQVSQGAVDCGIIYATDAYSAGLTVVDTATPEMCRRAIYPAAVLNTSAHPEAAQAFLDYLQTEACTQVFTAVGFSVA